MKYSAAVLIALYNRDDQWHFPLIKRVEDEYAHSGQIALPGGRTEPDETIEETGLRETEEEIGLNSKSVNIIGKLTPLKIPVSRFLVHPLVGIVKDIPEWVINHKEVHSIFSVSIAEICMKSNIKTETWKFRNRYRKVPFFYLYGYKIWGATAMILSEFCEILNSDPL